MTGSAVVTTRLSSEVMKRAIVVIAKVQIRCRSFTGRLLASGRFERAPRRAVGTRGPSARVRSGSRHVLADDRHAIGGPAPPGPGGLGASSIQKPPAGPGGAKGVETMLAERTYTTLHAPTTADM